MMKTTNESQIRELVDKTIEHFKKSKYYKNKKLIKQVKMLVNSKEFDKNGKPKSKCICFVELQDNHVAKFVIDKLNNHALKDGKGLIIDFALDDARRVHKREVKLERVKEKGEKKKIAKKTLEKLDLNECNDIAKLKEHYEMCISRGKKQRIKKKLVKLGYSGPLENKVSRIELKKKVEEEESKYKVEAVDKDELLRKKRNRTTSTRRDNNKTRK